MYTNFDTDGGGWIGGLIWLCSWPMYVAFVIWAIWGISQFYENSYFRRSEARIYYILKNFDYECAFIAPTVSLLLITTIINLLYTRSLLMTFNYIWLLIGIFFTVFLLLILANHLLVKIKTLNQDYLLICNIFIMLALFLYSFFAVTSQNENISIPVNFWFYNSSTFICVFLLILFILKIKELLSYFILFNTYFCFTIIVFSFFFRLNTSVAKIFIFLFTPIVLLFIISKSTIFIRLV
jgi:hypothetical protein